MILKPLLLLYCIPYILGYSWQDYKKDFNKNYPTPEQDSLHQAAFNASMTYINEMNNLNLDYKLAPTKWSDRLEQQISQRIKVNIDKSNITPKTEIIKVRSGKSSDQNGNLIKVSAPTSLDWRTTGKVTPVKDQELCGCCWAFSTAAVAESLFLINNNTNVSASVQYLLECTKDSGCQGGYVNLAIRLALQNGLPSATKYPYLAAQYNGTLPSTAGICTVSSDFYKFPADTTTQNYYNLTNSDIKTLVQVSPIVALINANTAFMQYSSGIFKCNYTITESELNHAVVIIGYDAAGNYLIKNSWGKGWGNNGFGWVSGASAENCGIHLYAYQISSKTFVNSNTATITPGNPSNTNTDTTMEVSKYQTSLIFCWCLILAVMLVN